MPFIPSSLLIRLAAIPLVLAGLYPIWPSALAPVLVMDSALLLVALVDLVRARRPLVKVRVQVPEVMSLGRKHAILVEIDSIADRPLAIRLTVDLFDDGLTGDLPLATRLEPRTRWTGRFHVAPQERGNYQIGAIHVRHASPWGLWCRQHNIAHVAQIRVYPDVQSARHWELWAREERRAGRTRHRPRIGGENEFEQLRSYTRDDEFRSIDWRATARRGELIARQYQIESGQNLWLLLDSGRLMTARCGGASMFDHALNATLMLAHVATRTGDRVGLLTYANEVDTWVPAAGGKSAMHRLVAATYAVHPRLEEADHEAAVRFLNARVRGRSLVVLFSQVIDDSSADALVRSMRALTVRHLPLLILFRDEGVDAMLHAHVGNANPGAVYRLGAAAEIVTWHDALVQRIRASGVMVLEVTPGRLTIDLVNQYLEIKSRHLL